MGNPALATRLRIMRGSAIIALAVLATSMIVEDATAVDSSEQKDLTQLLKADQVHFEEHKDTSQRGISNESNLNSRQPDKAELACHQKGFGSRQHAFAKCPISLLGEVSEAAAAQEELVHAGGCHAKCKTCTTPRTRKAYHFCTSCHADTYLAVRKFNVKNGKNQIKSGECLPLPLLEDFDPEQGVQCSFSKCVNGDTGYGVGNSLSGNLPRHPFAKMEKITCTRICLLGGDVTQVRHLERFQNPERRTGRQMVSMPKFASPARVHRRRSQPRRYSAPVCAFHKIVMCIRNHDYDPTKCQACIEKKNCSLEVEKKNCNQKICGEKKHLSCVAIYSREQKTTWRASQATMGNLNDYKNECDHAIDPCSMAGMYF